MDDVDLIRRAAAAMRGDPDTRWEAVATLLTGGPLGYAQLVQSRPEFAPNYPDAGRAVAVARAYLETEA